MSDNKCFIVENQGEPIDSEERFTVYTTFIGASTGRKENQRKLVEKSKKGFPVLSDNIIIRKAKLIKSRYLKSERFKKSRHIKKVQVKNV